MRAPAIVVPAGYLLERQDSWNSGYRLFGPADIAVGLPDEVRRTAEVIVTGGSSLDRQLVESLPALRLVACFSTGIEGIDTHHLQARGLQLTTAGGVNAHDVADHAFALFLAQWHGLLRADTLVRDGGWQAGSRTGFSPRRSLRGKRAGIVGLGRIGEKIAARAAAHEMDVRWWGPRDKPRAPFERMPGLTDLAQWSDALFLACAASPENAGMINGPVLQALGPDAVLINITRGMLVDERALREALSRGTLGGAGLDVFDDEPTDAALWKDVPNCVLSPHIAGVTQEAGRDMFGQLRENIRRHFAGETLLTPYFG